MVSTEIECQAPICTEGTDPYDYANLTMGPVVNV